MTADKLYTSLTASNITISIDGPDCITPKHDSHFHLTALKITLKIISAQVVETPATSNISFQNYSHQDDNLPNELLMFGLKPFTITLQS